MLTLKQSMDLQRQGRLDDAERGYRAIVAAEPDNIDALYMLAVACRLRGDAVEAETLFARTVEARPDEGDLHLSLASTRALNGKLDEARRGYLRALELNPNLVGAHLGLGQLALGAGNDSGAESHFRIALRVGEDPHVLTGLGQVMALRGDWDAALRYLTRAAELLPDNAATQFLLGQTFARKGLTAFAQQALERCLQLQPQLHEAHAWLAEVLMHADRAADAEPHYRHLASIPGYEMRAQAGLGDVARAQNRMQDAVEHYRAVLAIDPRQKMPLRMLVIALAALGRNDEVVAALGDYLAREPDDDEIREMRADILVALGRHGEALADRDSIMRRRPADALAQARGAVLKERLGQLDEASEHARLALTLDPSQVDARLVLARAQTRRGELDAARATLDGLAQATRDSEQERQYQRALGMLHDAAGEPAAAVTHFAQAQRDLPLSLPPLAPPRPELAAALAETPDAPWAHAPVLLLGTPGSGVEQVADLLADQPALQVLRGRSSSRERADDFNHPRFQLYCGELDAAAREALRERYLQPLTSTGMDIERTLVDWLPRWDAHLLALMRRAMPGARLLIVDTDARDALVNWLGFGWFDGFACADVEACADWLARARAHIGHGAELDEPRRLVVRADELVGDGAAAHTLARFLGLDRIDFTAQAQRLSRLPATRFAVGHGAAYSEALAGAFARLDA